MSGVEAEGRRDATRGDWDGIRRELRSELGEERYERWFSAVDFSEDAHGIALGVPNLFIRGWIEQRYLTTVQAIVQRHRSGAPVSIRVSGELYRRFREEERAVLRERRERSLPSGPTPGDDRNEFTRVSRKLGLHERLTLESFVVGASNRIAYRAGLEVLENPGDAYNPLFVFGGCGVGKTHLIQGLTRRFLQSDRNARAREVLYLPCESFANQFIRSARERSVDRFRRRFDALRVLVVDDVQGLVAKRQTQEIFLHILDTIAAAGGQIILAGDVRPHAMTDLNPQLRGRLISGLSCRLEIPDYPTRVAILKREAARISARLPERLLCGIAKACSCNARELLGGFNKVLAVASLSSEPITEARLVAILDDCRPRPRNATIPGILEVVAAHTGRSPADLRSPSRARTLTAARHLAIYLARQLTPHSLGEIGSALRRNHTTATFAVQKIKRRIGTDPEFRREVDALIREIRGG